MDQTFTKNASSLNLCDRVDILDAIIHNAKTPLDSNGITELLDRCYPSFVKLCEALRGDLRAKEVQTSMTAEEVVFDVIMEDSSQRNYKFSEFDTDIENS